MRTKLAKITGTVQKDIADFEGAAKKLKRRRGRLEYSQVAGIMGMGYLKWDLISLAIDNDILPLEDGYNEKEQMRLIQAAVKKRMPMDLLLRLWVPSATITATHSKSTPLHLVVSSCYSELDKIRYVCHLLHGSGVLLFRRDGANRSVVAQCKGKRLRTLILKFITMITALWSIEKLQWIQRLPKGLLRAVVTEYL